MPDSLKPFWRFISDFKSLLAISAKLAAVAPFADLLIQIGPTWPARGVTATLSTMLQLCCLAIVFIFGNPAARRGLRRWLACTLGGLLLTSAVYLFVYNHFVITCPAGTQGMVTRGFVMNNNVKALLGTPNYPNEQSLLEGFGCDPRRVWTSNSVSTMEFVILCLWLAAWSAVACFFGIFALLQERGRRSPAHGGL